MEWQNLGLELLVDLTKKGELDPWDVDLVSLVDKFLAQIKEGELKRAGEIIFFVSVLLRIKSENIYERPQEELLAENILEENNSGNLMNGDNFDIFNEDFLLDDFDGAYGVGAEQVIKIKELDRFLIRNPKSIRKARSRKITLDDLIEIFKRVEIPKAKKKKLKTSWSDFESELEDIGEDVVIMREEDRNTDIMKLAHEENLEEKIALLAKHVFKILEIDKQTALEALESVFGNKIDTFLSALFLSHIGKTELIQENFYKDIWLRRVA